MRHLDVLSGLAWLADQRTHLHNPALWALAIGAIITVGLIVYVAVNGLRPTRRCRPPVERWVDPAYDHDDDPRRTR